MKRLSDLYGEILDQGPSLTTLHLVLEKMREEKRFSEVVRACNEGLRRYPDDIRLRRMLAECYMEMGFFSLAETEVNLAVEKLEELLPLFKFQAEVFERQGRIKEAGEAARKYAAYFSGNGEAAQLFGRLAQTEEAFPSESDEVPNDQDSPISVPEEIVPEIATHTLAEIYESQGQIQAAIQTYRELIEQNPEDHRARERLERLSAGTEPGEDLPVHPLERWDGRERMIGVLEGWLARIQEINRAR